MLLHPTVPVLPLMYHLPVVLLTAQFNKQMKLHVISWNACGITNWTKLTALKAYIHTATSQVILIQEAFVGHALPAGEAPSLSGYT